MANKKPKVYCKIFDYVTAVDPELSQLIKATCTELTMSSLKRKPGITFLMPQDDKFRKKIADHAYSDKEEDFHKACDMLNALIIRDVLKTPGDWMSKKDDIPNSLYPSQTLEVDKVDGAEVVFKSGARAKIDPVFKDGSHRARLAVWKLTGEIPVTTDRPATMKYARTPNKPKTGSYDAGDIKNQTERFKIALAVENTYVLGELQRKSGGGLSGTKDVYLEYTLSLVNYILNIRKEIDLIYAKILPLLSFDNIDFYFLLEPHKSSGSYLIEDSIIHEWWLQRAAHKFDIPQLMKQITSLLSSGKDALIYTDRSAIFDKLGEIRQRICAATDARPRNCIEEIAKIYSEIEQSNTIPGMSEPLYPRELAAVYASEPGLKLIQDELRYLTYGSFKRLESAPEFDNGAYNELLNMIGECLHAGTPDDRSSSQKLLNRNTIKYLISPTERIQEVKIFVYSTAFCYVPLTEDDAMNLKQKHSTQRPDVNNIVIFNIQKDLYVQHKRVLSDAASSSGLAEALKSLDLDSLDPALKEELKRKFS